MKLNDEIIDDYLLGTLSPADHAEFEALLKSDASARERLADAKLLLEMLEASAPEVPSKRMWAGIRAKIALPTADGEPSFLERLSSWLAGPRLRMGLAGAMAVFFVVIGLRHMREPQALDLAALKNEAPAPAAAPAKAKEKAAPAMASRRAEKRSVMAAKPAPAEQSAAAPAPAMAAAPKEAVKRGPTEVEKALAEQDLDGVIATMLRQRQNSAVASMSLSGAGSGGGARAVSYGGAPLADRAMGEEEAYDSSEPLPSAPSRVDSNGFWDFRAAALALNRRDWLTATRELQAASNAAPEAAERSFARSTLHLLSAGGRPVVAKADLGESKELNVQSAQRWQVFVDSHVARYFGGVVARMPGLRSEGNELVLDMAVDRASFSPGTRFVKLSEEDGKVSQVKDSAGETVDAVEFGAPRGADYLLRANELRLK